MDPKKLVQEFIDSVWNKNNPELVSKFIDENYVVHMLGSQQDGKGIDFVKSNVTSTHQKYPHFQMTIEDMVCENDRVASRLLLSSSSNSKEITCREFVIHKFQDFKIIEAWALGSQWT